MNRILGIFLLLFFPLVVLIDAVVICPDLGIRAGTKDSVSLCWSCWRHEFWDSTP